MFKPRPKQAEILSYTHGKLGISAVPGSGKTATLSYLAAKLVATTNLADNQEIHIVTLVKSAVGNFAQSLARYLREEFQLLPNLGYRVRTLHSLANDIVRERPSLVGLADDFQVMDERSADDLLQEAVEAWVRLHPNAPDEYLTEEQFGNAFTRGTLWQDLVKSIAMNGIRQMKDAQLSVEDAKKRFAQHEDTLPLLAMCIEIYETYEKGLRYRGAVDFQDLIRLALRVLELDTDYLARLQQRWVYILEDEAQDSSLLQEQILRRLGGENGNWVRVGDPNQAIYETFTTANPKYLRDFLTENGVSAKTLPNSGRSTQSIIRLANRLIEWSLTHPIDAIRLKAPLGLPYIETTPPDDPQGNPPDNPAAIHFHAEKLSPEQEKSLIVKSLQHWLAENPDKTCAVLLPINSSGAKMVQELRRLNIPYVENLRSTSGTRAVVGALSFLLDYLQNPQEAGLLTHAYRVWRRDERGDEESQRSIENISKELRKIARVEDFLYPRVHDWLEENVGEYPDIQAHLREFRLFIRRWQSAVDLPIDQLLLTISADLFHSDTEITTAYSVALYMRRFAELHPEARLGEYTSELQAIARGQRSFSGMNDDDDAFNPEHHKGKVTVTTMHKAKGLEWDRVYLMSANNYDYPSADSFDNFMGEKWFIRHKLNLEAEAVEQLNCLLEKRPYQEGIATQEARIEYSAERLRLLYVGITRAKRELIVTWNSGRNGEQVEARPVAMLRGWWEKTKKQA